MYENQICSDRTKIIILSKQKHKTKEKTPNNRKKHTEFEAFVDSVNFVIKSKWILQKGISIVGLSNIEKKWECRNTLQCNWLNSSIEIKVDIKAMWVFPQNVCK